MCAIAGVVGSGAMGETSLVGSMTALMVHRGPDDSGIWSGPDVALGHRRLSIIDLTSAGHQPMGFAEGRYTITYNGEIYNYVELKEELLQRGHAFRSQTDTEVLLAAYAEWGEECVHRLNGMWAFAIWDKTERKLFASRDRFGKKPFYYTQWKDRLYFASEMKALFLIPGLHRTLNRQAVVDFCAERISDHSEQTFLEEIRQLPPAGSLIWRDGHMETKTYWSLPDREEVGPGPKLEEIAYLLEDAVRIRLRADTPIGCLASGGLDSSTVACLMRRNYVPGKPIHLFSTLTDPPTEEAGGLASLKNQAGFEFHEHLPDARLFWEDLPRLLWHQEQPFADGSMAAHYALMREARKAGVPVLLTGQGGDEVFAGYPTYLWVYLGSLLNRGRWGQAFRCLRQARRHQALNYPRILFHTLPRGLRKSVRRCYLRQRLDWVHPDLLSNIKVREEYPYEAGSDELREYMRNSIAHWTLPGFLHYEDRNSMAFGVETRLPFLDYRLVEKMSVLPSSRMLPDGRTKELLRRIALPIVPHGIVERSGKQGYPAPLDRWIRSLQDEVRQIVYSSVVENCPILRVAVWRKQVEEFLRNKDNRLEPVWRGLICALWHEQIFRASLADHDRRRG